MIARNLILTCAGVVVASFAGFAGAEEAMQPVSRADVVAEVVRASALGTLVPAGEATPFLALAPVSAPLVRVEVRRSTRMSIHNGVMLPAGETTPYFVSGGVSTMTRAERKADVLRARATGELLPAGEGTLVVVRPAAAARATAAAEGEERPKLAAR